MSRYVIDSKTPHLNDWTRKALLALPVRDWMAAGSEYDSILILATGKRHESRWGIMAVIGVNAHQPVEVAVNCCDDVEWKFPPMVGYGRDYHIGQVRMDLAYRSKATHFWKDKTRFRVGAALSSIVIETVPKA